MHLGNFVTAEEAALCVARTPEGQAAAAKRPAAAPPLTSEEVGRRGARSLRRKELPGCREQVLTAVGPEAEVGAQEEAEEEAEEEEADVVVLNATVVEEEAEEEAEEAEDVQAAVVEMVEVVQVMEPEDFVDEGGRSEGRAKRPRNT